MIEKRRQNVVLSFYQPGICQQKWLRMGFEHMLAPTRDVIWIEVATTLPCKGLPY